MYLTYSSNNLSIYLSVYLFNYAPIHPSFYGPVCQFIYELLSIKF